MPGDKKAMEGGKERERDGRREGCVGRTRHAGRHVILSKKTLEKQGRDS